MGLIDRLKELSKKVCNSEPSPDEQDAAAISDFEYEGGSQLVVVVDPTLSKCRELVVYTGVRPEDIGIEAEMRKVRADLDKATERLDEAQRGIDQMEHELNLRYAPTVNELAALQEELMLMFQQRANQQRSESDPGTGSAESDDDDVELTPEDLAEIENVRKRMEGSPEQEEAVRNAERVLKSNRKLARTKKVKSERAKKLFQKIAKKTHPDKVKNAELNELFKKAKKAYEDHDVDMLQSVYDSLIQRGSNLFRSLLSRLNELKDELVEKRKAFSTLVHTQEYAMWIDYQVPELQSNVQNHFLRRVQQEIDKTLMAIRHLDPSRHQPPPAESFNLFKTDTKTVMGESSEDELDSPWDE